MGKIQVEPERLQKILTKAGIASRRQAEVLIAAGKVTVNGQIVHLGDKALPTDQIIVNGNLVGGPEEKIYIILNKPEKTVTTMRDPQGRTTVRDLVDVKTKIFPVGRLDYNTTGTLLMTNDGELAHRLAHPSYEIKRVYRARITAPLLPNELAFLNSDKVLVDGKPSQQTVTLDISKSYVITLHQGSYHHIKELFALVNREVISLTRIEYGGITHVQNLERGKWRYLKPYEIVRLKRLVGM